MAGSLAGHRLQLTRIAGIAPSDVTPCTLVSVPSVIASNCAVCMGRWCAAQLYSHICVRTFNRFIAATPTSTGMATPCMCVYRCKRQSPASMHHTSLDHVPQLGHASVLVADLRSKAFRASARRSSSTASQSALQDHRNARALEPHSRPPQCPAAGNDAQRRHRR